MFVSCTVRASNILLRDPNIVHENFCVGIILLKKLMENQILNIILTGWKVVGYSKKERIEDL